MKGTGAERFKPGDRVALALSGGVDSAVAAVRLKQWGFDVLAVHLILRPDSNSLASTRALAHRLGLKLEILNLEKEFDRKVITPFTESYLSGETPNPCVACNPDVKFGLLRPWARDRGARAVATGHYAALDISEPETGPFLVRPRDSGKDQTYFLCRLTPEILESTIFPLADMTKEEVRRQAGELSLPIPAESQEICFLPDRDYRIFLKKRLGNRLPSAGNFVDASGRVLGRHKGTHAYTIGQRRGLGIPGPEPYYVLAIQPGENRVVLGVKSQIRTRRIMVRDLVFSSDPPGREFNALVQIRSRHKPARARVTLLGDRAEMDFEEPQASAAPGQAAAVYDGERLLGGGWILPSTFYRPPPGPA